MIIITSFRPAHLLSFSKLSCHSRARAVLPPWAGNYLYFFFFSFLEGIVLCVAARHKDRSWSVIYQNETSRAVLYFCPSMADKQWPEWRNVEGKDDGRHISKERRVISPFFRRLANADFVMTFRPSSITPWLQLTHVCDIIHGILLLPKASCGIMHITRPLLAEDFELNLVPKVPNEEPRSICHYQWEPR